LAGPGQQPWPYFPSRLARAENGHEVYRAKQAERAPTLRYRTPADRRSRVQRWLDAVSELQELQGDYQGWLDALPESMADGATADALRAICDLDLSELQSIVPPKGFGRD